MPSGKPRLAKAMKAIRRSSVACRREGPPRVIASACEVKFAGMSIGVFVELAPEERHVVRPLFESFPFLPTVVCSILDDGFGQARADDGSAPRVARLQLDFNFLAGDATSPAAREMVDSMDSAVIASEAWERTL